MIMVITKVNLPYLRYEERPISLNNYVFISMGALHCLGYSTSSLLQMIGRAGRPGHDQIGKAVIMTNENDERHYKTLLSNRHPVESTLASCLAGVSLQHLL